MTTTICAPDCDCDCHVDELDPESCDHCTGMSEQERADASDPPYREPSYLEYQS